MSTIIRTERRLFANSILPKGQLAQDTITEQIYEGDGVTAGGVLQPDEVASNLAAITTNTSNISALQIGKLEKYPTITPDSDGHTVTDADNDKLFLLDSSGGAFAIELPTGVQVGTSVGFLLETAGNDVTFQSTSGATINSKDSSVILNIATGYVSATCIATDTWWIAGDLL